MDSFYGDLATEIETTREAGIGGILRLEDHTILYVMDGQNVDVQVFDAFERTHDRYSTSVESFQAALNIAMFGEEGVSKLLRTPEARVYSVAEYDMTKSTIRWIP